MPSPRQGTVTYDRRRLAVGKAEKGRIRIIVRVTFLRLQHGGTTHLFTYAADLIHVGIVTVGRGRGAQ